MKKTTSPARTDHALLHRIATIVQRVVPRDDSERRDIEEFVTALRR